MTSRFVLDEFNLDLSSSRLLIRLGFVSIVVFIVKAAVYRVVVIDEPVLSNGRGGCWRCMAIRSSGIGTLAFTHRG